MATEAVHIPPADVVALCHALAVLDKIDHRILSTHLIKRRPADPKRLPGGWTEYYRHERLSDGTHIAMTHVLVDVNGTVIHRHCKSILVGTIRFCQEREAPQ